MNIKKGETLELAIDDMAFGGKGISRVATEQGNFVVFVANSIPGQTVEVTITKKRKKHAETRLKKVIKRSPEEVEMPQQPISGAPFLTLPVEKQRAFKEETTLTLFEKMGQIKNVRDLFDEYIASPSDFNYRNKMEYSFSVIRHDLETNEEHDDFALGFKHRGTWWKVENLDKESGLFDAEFENKLKEIRVYLENTGLPAWHPPKKEGFFRHLVVRKSFADDELLINLVTSSINKKAFDTMAFVAFLQGLLGKRLAGFIHTINDDVADRAKLEKGPSDTAWGKSTIIERVLGLQFEISMQSFFQTNPASAERLYSKVVDYATEDNDLENQVIMDLFCGTGTIGQILASKTKNAKIIGVDIIASAIENAKRNAALNQIEGVDFYAADVGKFLLEYPEYEGKIGTIVLDPPRGGIAPKTLRKVMRLGAKRIVYVSCNPATQARDAIELKQAGYALKKVSLVDQFPHTAHIESIMLFEK
ncbi:MAG: 23S rRNA (uracil(1939)-C(5))-methyltransferase RlmD [Flavobacteriales bacterium]|jgi:23S rRNA (uracil-5-)-methyltransferase RumA|nr:23S rRNA (uracil(1939)-C(5))-methyltransferase RlmD [Flavobacteriales bacterium]